MAKAYVGSEYYVDESDTYYADEDGNIYGFTYTAETIELTSEIHETLRITSEVKAVTYE